MSLTNFLHGVEVIDIDSGLRPIQTLRMSVIGLIGTAPDADPDAFPLNTPVLFVGREPDKLAKLGTRGTLPWSMDGIFDQAGATVAVIRVARPQQPRTSTLEALTNPTMKITGYVMTRHASDFDPLPHADIVAISRVEMGLVAYEKGVDWKQTGDNIQWLRYAEVESVIRRIGTTDPIAYQDTILAVQKVYKNVNGVEIVFTSTTDYTHSENGITWTGANPQQPAEHDEYFIQYEHGKRPANNNPYEVDYSYYRNANALDETVNRGTGHIDALAHSPVIRVNQVTAGAITYQQGTDFVLENDKIRWLYVEIVETVIRGIGTTDELAHSNVLSVSEISQGASQYTANTDFTVTGNQIDWSGGSAEPAEGEQYTVTYRYGTRPAFNADYVVNYDYRTGEHVALSAVVGGVNPDGSYAGVHAFLSCQSTIKVTPRILIAPGFSQHPAVLTEMVGIAEELRAVIIADGPNTNDYDAIGYREQFGSKRIYIEDPWVQYWNATLNAIDAQPASARIAGIIAKSDEERGFYWSPSNRLINGIMGLHRPISFTMGDPNSRANFLNENEVATIIQQDGYRLWGNRTCSYDARWMFLSAVRIDDAIEESLKAAMLWAIDRNITRTFFEEVAESVNAYCRYMAQVGAIIIGNQPPCWVDPNMNTPDQIMLGKAVFNFDYDRPYPAEHIVFQRFINHDYLTTIFSGSDSLIRTE